MTLGKGNPISLHPSAFEQRAFKPAAKNDKLTEVVSFRVEQGEKRKVDEILAVIRNEGSQISTPSDVYRWAGEVAVEWLGEQVTALLKGEERSSWLTDQIELDKLDRQLDDQLSAESRVTEQLTKLKNFCKNKLATGDHQSALIAMNRLAESINRVSDPIWKNTMRAEIGKDTELRGYQQTLRDHGYFTHLYNNDLDYEQEFEEAA